MWDCYLLMASGGGGRIVKSVLSTLSLRWILRSKRSLIILPMGVGGLCGAKLEIIIYYANNIRNIISQ